MAKIDLDKRENFNDNGDSAESSIDVSSLSGVLNMILSLFKKPEAPIEPLPPPLIMVGSQLRPGISAKEIASRVISRQAEAGLPVGDVFDDGPNTTEALMVIQIEEIINALQTESVVNVVIPPGIPVTVTGANAGGPFIAMGTTVNMGVGNGIIR